MKSWYAMSGIGKDRPGIVADLAELIFDHGCNLEDSSMTVLGSEFAVLLLFTGEGTDLEERLSAGCKRIEWERPLTVFFRPLDGEPEGYGTREEREGLPPLCSRDRSRGARGPRLPAPRRARRDDSGNEDALSSGA